MDIVSERRDNIEDNIEETKTTNNNRFPRLVEMLPCTFVSDGVQCTTNVRRRIGETRDKCFLHRPDLGTIRKAACVRYRSTEKGREVARAASRKSYYRKKEQRAIQEALPREVDIFD